MKQELIPQAIEEFTKNAVIKDLSKGDPLWDIPHTTAVVYHAKEILATLPEVDSIVVILAAYGHDWGYSHYYVSGRSMTKQEYMDAKKTHAGIGAEKMRELLAAPEYNSLAPAQKARVVNLILHHDDYKEFNSLKDQDALVLMEADTIGGLDTDFVTSTWTREQDLKHMQDARAYRLPYFVTVTGKNAFETCYDKRLAAIDQIHKIQD